MEKRLSRERYVEVCIIGAGPAGINAAAYLSAHGVESLVIEEAPKSGGAVYRGPTRENASLSHLDEKLQKDMRDLHDLYRRHSSKIEVLTAQVSEFKMAKI